MYHRLILLFLIAFFLIGCTNPTPPSTAVIPENGVITLGVIAGSAVDDERSLQSLADALAGQLKEHGISSGQARVADSTQEMAAWLESGEVDLYFDGVYPALLVSEQSGARLILRGWQFGRPDVQSVFFARRDSGLTSLDDLRGKMLALLAPQSTAGFFLPSVHLLERGLTLTGKSNFSEPLPPSELGFAFSGNDQDTLRAVISGSAAAGAVDDYHFDIVFPPETTQQLAELARTEKIPRQVVLARPGMEERYLAALTQTLTRLHESETGKLALASFQTNRFDPFPGGVEAASRRLRDMLTIVRKISLP